MLGIRWWGQGSYARPDLDASTAAVETLYNVRTDDFVFNKIWARNGAVALIHAEHDLYHVSGEFPTFAIDQDTVLPAWLEWYTRTTQFWADCDVLSRGTSGKNRIRPERFASIRIPVPPIDEQREILDTIESVHNAVDQIASVSDAAIVSNNIRRLVASEEARIWTGGTISGVRPLCEVTEFLSRGRQSEQGDSDHLLIKSQHVQMGNYIPSKLRLARWAAKKVKPSAFVQDHDILIACSASGCLGRVALYKGASGVASTDTHVAIARANRELIDPTYLYVYLLSWPGQYELRSRERGRPSGERVGYRLAELNLADLKQVPIPVPSMPMQLAIADHIILARSAADEYIKMSIAMDSDLKRFMPSFLNRIFREGLMKTAVSS
jgi:type I restriction enzyme S subunit